jgi:ATPase
MGTYAFLPDTSVIYNRRIIEIIENGVLERYTPIQKDRIRNTPTITIVLSRVMLSEIENQANQTKSQENIGLEVLKELYNLNAKKKILLEVIGNRPTLENIKLNPSGELDALIRKDAFESKSILITADEIQSSIALVEGIEVLFTMNVPELDNSETLGRDEKPIPQIQDFFDDKTMSVHLRGHCRPLAKRGRPGDWRLETINDQVMEPHFVDEISNNIIRMAKNDEKSFIEKNEPGVSVIQMRNYRIVICRPPFSNTYEVTAVRPLVSLTLKDYNLPRKMIDRLDVAEGILVAGSPGAGKSTFISALTLFYLEKKKLVKTLESVRDLNVPPEVSQYAPLDGSLEKTSDILLLIRPDFTIFDEVRVAEDFKIFGDMRLAGVGLVGVVHASRAIDSIQRFIRRVELGVIPNVVDTVIFIKEGQVAEILSLEMTVKKPTGFTDKDLSRPVIEVRDFLDGTLLYEIYNFGSDTIVNSVGKQKRRSMATPPNRGEKKRKTRNAYKEYQAAEYTPHDEQIAIQDDEESEEGENLDNSGGAGEFFPVSYFNKSKSIIFQVDRRLRNSYVNFYIDGNHIFSATLNKEGEVSVKTKSPIYSKVQKAIRGGRQIEASLE